MENQTNVATGAASHYTDVFANTTKINLTVYWKQQGFWDNSVPVLAYTGPGTGVTNQTGKNWWVPEWKEHAEFDKNCIRIINNENNKLVMCLWQFEGISYHSDRTPNHHRDGEVITVTDGNKCNIIIGIK